MLCCYIWLVGWFGWLFAPAGAGIETRNVAKILIINKIIIPNR